MDYQVSQRVQQLFDKVTSLPAVQQAMEYIKADEEHSIEEQIELTLIEAPTFHEERRAAAFCEKLYTTRWVGDIVRTFNGNGNAIEYLARYTFRTAISNSRIMDYDGETVTFSVTNRDTSAKEPVTLPAMEFIRRFLSHVLPKGFTRVRYSGFLSNARKTRKLQSIHRQRRLPAYMPSPLTGASKRELFLALWNTDISVCKCCGAQLIHLPRGQPVH